MRITVRRALPLAFCNRTHSTHILTHSSALDTHWTCAASPCAPAVHSAAFPRIPRTFLRVRSAGVPQLDAFMSFRREQKRQKTAGVILDDFNDLMTYAQKHKLPKTFEECDRNGKMYVPAC